MKSIYHPQGIAWLQIDKTWMTQLHPHLRLDLAVSGLSQWTFNEKPMTHLPYVHTYIVGVSPWPNPTVTPMSLLTGSLVITVRFFNATYDFMITPATDTDHTQWWNFRIKLWTDQGVVLLWLPQSWSGHRNTLGKNFIDSIVIYTRYLFNEMYSRYRSDSTQTL